MPSLVTLPILEVRSATPRSRSVWIGDPDLSFEFRAGQAVMVGTHGQAVRRPYSIASSPEETAAKHVIELLVGIGPSGAPGPQLERLEPGILVDVEGPIGGFQFPAEPAARHFLFIAGGSGIAPLRSMMRHALAVTDRDGLNPHVGLIYSARTKDEFAYADELETLAAGGSISLMLTVTRPEDGSLWSGSRGRIGAAHLKEMIPHGDTLCFICGPRALVDEMPKLLKDVGVDGERIRIEEW